MSRSFDSTYVHLDADFVAKLTELSDDLAQQVGYDLECDGVPLVRASIISGAFVRSLTQTVLSPGSRLESPVEALFFVAMNAMGPMFTPSLLAAPQRPVGRFRADFAVFSADEAVRNPVAEVPDDRCLFVEVDGHDFHERTKEQAEHDRARDRWFQQSGLTVVRFTGREVWRDAMECAREAHRSYMAAFDGEGS